MKKNFESLINFKKAQADIKTLKNKYKFTQGKRQNMSYTVQFFQKQQSSQTI